SIRLNNNALPNTRTSFTLNSQGSYPLLVEIIISIPANLQLQLINFANVLYQGSFDIASYVLYNKDSASIPKEDVYEYPNGYI
ncbi:hypothetical protein P4U42_25195, partial [Bacillus paranthracis]|uniref:hypothetical protein n=1 Tax=Bacillus paranthracis TaxID=2026186 RepID=UPI002E22EF27|nr:hypothetical protein [Bacillus paranthracis]